jgi:hypothetical protein
MEIGDSPRMCRRLMENGEFPKKKKKREAKGE